VRERAPCATKKKEKTIEKKGKTCPEEEKREEEEK
jgi:hypothetical protein